jgi:hypothetical protein
MELFDIKAPGSNEAFLNAVMKKSQRKTRSKKHILRFAVAAAMLTVFTLTVGAVNDWKYDEAFKSFFRNSQRFVEGFENRPSYTLVKNTFKGVDFHLSGLYANGGVILLEIDVMTNKRQFKRDDTTYLLNGQFELQREIGFTGYTASGEQRSVKINDKHITALNSYFFIADEYIGEEMTYKIDMLFGDETIEGYAEIKFNIDAESFKPRIEIYPEAELLIPGYDLILEKVFLMPNVFALTCEVMSADENSGFGINEVIEVSLKMNDGEIIPINEYSWAAGNRYGRTLTEDGNYLSKTTFDQKFVFTEEPIDVYTVEAVFVNGIEIPLN